MAGTANIEGKVWLIGAGPGDVELLTLTAVRALGEADVALVDDLVNREVLQFLKPGSRVIEVGKRGGCKSTPQAFIERQMVKLARDGNVVARIKGGDPFVFGRGGEELEACRAAGVPVEVVPGITSALGAAAAAQIPLTHRANASIVSFVTGQCKGLTEQDWSGLAGKVRTLVIYMGLASAAQIAEKLIADSLSPALPVVVIENATKNTMRVLRAPIAGLADLVTREQVKSPALIVVGEVAEEPEHSLRELALEIVQ